MKLMQLPEEVRERILDTARNVISSKVAGTTNLINSWNEVLLAEYVDPTASVAKVGLPNTQVVSDNPAIPPETLG